jgi:hypothetical protein
MGKPVTPRAVAAMLRDPTKAEIKKAMKAELARLTQAAAFHQRHQTMYEAELRRNGGDPAAARAMVGAALDRDFDDALRQLGARQPGAGS